MSFKYIFAIVAVIPLVCAYNTNSNGYGSNSIGYGSNSNGYGSNSNGYGLNSNGYGSNTYNLPSSSYGLDELTNAATGSQQSAGSITSNAEVAPTPAESARLGNVQAQVQALNSNPTYQNLQNSEAIAESLAESNLASNIRQGNVNVVSPNIVNQDVFRSLFVPTGRNNHQVIATQPLPPIVVTQPGAPPAQVSSGPAAVVKAAPVIYKIKPSVIYQQEVINKVPTPLSLNPVYVKVYKPGKKIDAPVAPVVQPVYSQASYQAPTYASQYGSSADTVSDSYSNAGNAYASQQSYGASPAYAQSNYAPASYAPSGYAPAGYSQGGY